MLKPLAVAFWGTVVIVATIAALATAFTRETSGLTERWGNRTLDQRQTEIINPLLAIASSPNFQSNIGSGTNPQPSGGDYDGDGIPDEDDPDPTNPDSDGDGTIDGKDPSPTDPTDGGPKPVPPTPPNQPAPQLFINSLVKTANGTHFLTTSVGSTIAFKIKVEAASQGGNHTLVIKDELARSFLYQTGTVERSDGVEANLTASQLSSGYRVHLSGAARISITLSFTVQATAIGNFENIATAYELNRFGGLSDKAYVRVVADGAAPGSPDVPICTICSFAKFGRLTAAEPWSIQVFATTGQAVDFYIYIETASPITPQTFVVTDALPADLRYVPDSTRVVRDGFASNSPIPEDWFTKGLRMTTSGSSNKFEIYFSATVEAAGIFALTNTAKVTDWTIPANLYTASMIIRPKF